MQLHKITKISLGLLFIGAIACLFLFPKSPPVLSSSLTGLQQLKVSVQAAVSYSLAIENSLPTVIEFYANWCTTCQSMAPAVHKIEQEYDKQINWVMINIDNPEYTDTIEQYQVQAVPQFTFLDAENVWQNNLMGKIPQSILLEQVIALQSDHRE
ncbi:thioredoxin domain-containing protein [Roseofilum sp. BLCC_M154]|uniref:Thioredoxin domain-containing protein n=1 Tax=Roseofilum acuticapitatum BLCC-M154 TaxID=3022444 RepID=A0ABT7AWU1_9CYAN|nr:thioredoxin domain-containing protein [Roseofilum acuticapitatum]MDJ1170513.1 thioredoxin domain-containing protein [Roseofilum acuticapitatum BLCC-M154]